VVVAVPIAVVPHALAARRIAANVPASIIGVMAMHLVALPVPHVLPLSLRLESATELQNIVNRVQNRHTAWLRRHGYVGAHRARGMDGGASTEHVVSPLSLSQLRWDGSSAFSHQHENAMPCAVPGASLAK
jgi:hypothetical protein